MVPVRISPHVSGPARQFRPPHPSPLVQGMVNLLYPALLAGRERVCRIRIEPEDWQRLEALRGQRALLLPNHPSETEPCILVGVARRLREPVFYVATNEIFHGFDGWVIQRMGAFSIRRGWPDRQALRTARQVLARENRKLVLFPEGETHMCNDQILPLHKGAIQIGFWALEHLEAQEQHSHASVTQQQHERSGASSEQHNHIHVAHKHSFEVAAYQPQHPAGAMSLPVVPLAIRYRFVGDASPALLRRLARLEAHLGLAPLPPPGSRPAMTKPLPIGVDASTIRQRLLRAGLSVLFAVEREYGVRADIDTPPDMRIAALYGHIARRVAQLLHVPVPEPLSSVQVSMRALFNATFDYLDGLSVGTTTATSYERRLQERRVRAAHTCLSDLWRVQNFMAVGEDYFDRPLTAERAGEILFRLEKEVYGRAAPFPWREAVVRIGEPIELAQFLPDYKKARKETLTRCTRLVEERLRHLLQSTQDLGTLLDGETPIIDQ